MKVLNITAELEEDWTPEGETKHKVIIKLNNFIIDSIPVGVLHDEEDLYHEGIHTFATKLATFLEGFENG